jgi:phosphoglycerol geranylgeranyltransferase
MNSSNKILDGIKEGKRLLVVLIDPDKAVIDTLPNIIDKINESIVTHIFVGGSTDSNQKTESVVRAIKEQTRLPVILFPGDYSQITVEADALLFLSLISGRNPEYLIEQQVQSIPLLRNTNLEVISTGYILVDGGVITAVQRVSNTQPMCQENTSLIVDTAIAGEYSGKKLIYLEAGSGASRVVSQEIIKSVKKQISIPLIVGGGIRSKEQLENAYNAGADVVVIGTAFENDTSFFDDLKKT